jgi:bacterial/archaeal transporter family protein
MNWIYASLLSAFLLGLYDLCAKHSVRENAVLPVLFFSTLCGAAVWLALFAVEIIFPHHLPPGLVADPITFQQHLLLALKSAIVAASWLCTYFAVKHLPVSLAAPVRATSPLWTLLGALVILGERPTLLEMLGVVITITSFVGLSAAGKHEGVDFSRNKWIWFIIAGSILGAASSLYDKYLLARLHFTVPTVQAWFSFYLAVIFAPFMLGWKLRWWPRQEFHWRWSIPAIALALLAADYVYFSALRQPGALVSLVMSLRRGSALVAFAGGLLFFGEQNGWRKLPAVLGILAGIVLTILG